MRETKVSEKYGHIWLTNYLHVVLLTYDVGFSNCFQIFYQEIQSFFFFLKTQTVLFILILKIYLMSTYVKDHILGQATVKTI